MKFIEQRNTLTMLHDRNGRNNYDQRMNSIGDYIRKSWLIILFGVILTFAGVFVLLKNEVGKLLSRMFTEYVK